MARQARRGGVAVLVVIAVTVGLVLGAKSLWRAAQSAVKAQGCSFGSYNLTLDQTTVASTMVSVVIKRALPERAAVLALGAALQESKLTNIPSGAGDRDSVGVLQQRPSQGWGTAAQLADVHYATGKFLDAVVKVPNWQNDSLASVVQAVQISADGQAYARHEGQATAISQALMGSVPAGIACTFDKPTQVAAAESVLGQLRTDLPVNQPAATGPSLTVPGASWATAAWFVAHANQFGIDSVRYSGKLWSRSKGWRDTSGVTSDQVSATLGT